jgi:nucleotide-binding universal stress UspA family protein
MKPRRILVGVDGSDNSLAAVTWAADLASCTGAEVVAVHVLGLLERMEPGAPAVPVESHLDQIRDRFEHDWCAPLAGLAFSTELRYGSPVGVILDMAEEADADLVVVGSRGLGGFADLRLGSTSSQIAQHAGRAVLIVPPPATRRSRDAEVASRT